MGILIMPGWCCCDQWERWTKWDPEDHRVSVASLRDQALRLRNHPSIFVWLNGSDNPPTAAVEKAYLDTLQSVNWCKPTLSNATDQPGPVSGPSGVKMRGPYDYEPPSYWLTDTKHGGAFGFATEISPGAAPPPIESLREMLPPEHLWPIDEFWNYHATLDMIKDVDRFTAALEARYGKATGVEDYARKAQAMTYDGERAMFEGYGRNKYTSTGVIQWMLNNAWPSVMWHLYDYYLRPGGGYFGTKKACEPVHVQYSYDDRSIAIVNDTYQAAKGLKLSATVFDLNLVQKFRQDATIDAPADAVARSFTIPQPDDVNGAYFVRLDLADTSGRLVSHNFYWLSTKDDVLDWADNTNWFYTPTKQHGDLTALGSLPATTLTVTMAPASAGKRARVVVRNTGKALAFQVRLKAVDKASGKEILPVYWQDNYFELFPGESREIEVSWAPGASAAKVVAEAWNAR
jgi:exo-1,4-beta-D-glucosaminidase